MFAISEFFLVSLLCSLFFKMQNSAMPVIHYFLIFFSCSLWQEIMSNKKLQILLYAGFIFFVFGFDKNISFFSPLLLISNFENERQDIENTDNFLIVLNLLLKVCIIFCVIINFNITFFVFTIIIYFFSIQKNKYINYEKKFNILQDELTENKLETEKQKRRLQNDALKNSEVVVLAERNRISGSLHNSIGHTLSSAILQVNALKYISENEKVINSLNILQNSLEKGMTEVRECLHNIHDDSFDLQTAIESIIAKTNNLNIILSCKIENLSYVLKHDILSIVKECISNTIKHSGASEMKISILEQPGFYSVSIYDNGKGFNLNSQKSKGIGLTILTEIVEKNKGTINFYSDKGFRIHIVFLKQKSAIPPQCSEVYCS